VRVDVELGSEAEHALLGAHVGGVELRVADRGLEDAFCGQTGGKCLRRKGIPRVADRLSTEQVRFELEVGSKCLKRPPRLASHLRPDAVSQEDDDGQVSTPSRASTASASVSIPTGSSLASTGPGVFKPSPVTTRTTRSSSSSSPSSTACRRAPRETPAAVSPKTPACCARTLMLSPTSSSGTA